MSFWTRIRDSMANVFGQRKRPKKQEEIKQTYGKYKDTAVSVTETPNAVIITKETPKKQEELTFTITDRQPLEPPRKPQTPRMPDIKTIQPKVPKGSIDGKETNTAKRDIQKNQGVVASNSIIHLNTIEQLLENKIKDEKLRKDILKNKKILLQHRIVATINLGNGAEFQMVGYLPEHEESIREYWTGTWVDKSVFKESAEYFGKEMRNKLGTKAVLITSLPPQGFEVKRITINMTMK